MAKNITRIISFASSSTSRTLTTETVVAPKTPKIKDKSTSLYRRLAALNHDSDASETLNDWVSGGKKLGRREIINIVDQLRKYKRYSHSLQILEWMEKRVAKLAPADHAMRLDLLSKKDGIKAAERYFASFPDSPKNKPIYGALLHCYCKENMKEKALAIFDKMKELDVAFTGLMYNNLLSLHLRVGEPEKIPLLLEEMKEKNITPDFHTYNFLMNSYASLKDMEGVEGVLETMKAAGVKCDWITYTNLACIYIKAGLLDKANSALEKLENMGKIRDRKAYHMLITLYAQTSNKEGVKRIWNYLKSKFSDTTNISYLAMLHALSQLGDIDELQKCFDEWESSSTTYDIRLANVLIDFYLSRDMVREANLLSEDAMKRGAKPNLRTFEMFMNFYLKKRQMDLALKNFEGACFEAKENKWRPCQKTVTMFWKHFEEEKYIDGAERLYNSLKNANSVNSELYCSLLKVYIAAGLKEPHMRQRMEEDGMNISFDIEKLLEIVCPK